MALPTLISDAKFAEELQKQYVIEGSLEIFARLEKGSIESAIPNREKLYCPHKNCAKLLSHDPDDDEEIIVKGKCPWCEEMLCARCRVPWHTRRDCQQFQKEEKDREDDLGLSCLLKTANGRIVLIAIPLSTKLMMAVYSSLAGVKGNFATHVEKLGAKGIGIARLVNHSRNMVLDNITTITIYQAKCDDPPHHHAT